jgi:outer membrane receptor protein involved in Fe transport
LTFSDGSAPELGSSGFLPSIEKQNSYVVTDNFAWVKGRHSLKFGTELRFEQFTIFPSASCGTADFSAGFTDNPASPGTGGYGFASFLLGPSDGGSIVNLHNVDYRRQIYAGFVQDDFKKSSRLTFNLGSRYELYTTVKAADNEQANFNFACVALSFPSQPVGLGLCPRTERTALAGIPSGLCSRAKPGRVSVEPLETTRTAQFLPADLLAAESLRPQGTSSHGQTNHAGHRLLGSSRTVLASLYYANLNKYGLRCSRFEQQSSQRAAW